MARKATATAVDVNDVDRKLASAKVDLVLTEPFFGSLVGRLPLVRAVCRTAFTNGKIIGYSPAFFAPMSIDHIKTVLAHEILHCAAGHPWRRDGRDPRRWNIACDYAVNEALVTAGYSLPEGGLLDQKYYGMSAEQIYSHLPEEKLSKKGEGGGTAAGAGGSGEPDNDPGDMGEVRDDPGISGEAGEEDGDEGSGGKQDAESAAAREADWHVAVSQAAILAAGRGQLSAAFKGALDELRRSRVDYKSIMRRFFQTSAKEDYTWRRLNRRYPGIFLPSVFSERMGPAVVGVDDSGSISMEQLSIFGGDVDAIVTDVRPEKTYVVYNDAVSEVKDSDVDVYEPGEEVKITRRHGGGTDFRPVFAWVEKEGIEPVCLVYLTDMDGEFPTEPPPYPVLWISTKPHKTAPFGEVVFMDMD